MGNAFALLNTNILEKCSDLGMFFLPCTVGNSLILHAMLDLGASINVIIFSAFKDIELNNLQKRMFLYNWWIGLLSPLGIVEDVLVKVGNQIFLVDFYILEMKGASISNHHIQFY